jgi:predicted dehydrogenase
VISRTFAVALAGLDGARLLAANDIDPGAAERFAGDHGPLRVMPLDGLLASADIDVVCVCVPSGLHAEIGLAAVAAGKHVVVEKPIDIDLVAARRLVDRARDAGVSLSVMSQERYNPGIQRLKALLQDGALGDPLVVSASTPWYRSQAYYDSGAWRGTWALDGGGALMNQGVHYAELLCWLLGAPQVLSASCATLSHDIEVEDVALALLRFDSGAVGSLEATTAAYPGLARMLRLSGTKGTVLLQDETIVREELQAPAGQAGSGAPVARLQQPLAHRAQLADVVGALREGREPPVSGEDGCRALKVVLDVYRAAGWGPLAGRSRQGHPA